ncbi:hypothetical protein HYPSUDRAFT_36374 [Hypholoma sublateritium FD-334 SS-4]|uniref:Uncharacterized protein n=1 Tax=Hypholoma sublateritium (strain FD-334 SS-4) TaxID=945553 RepID=A0A0D2LGC3_HYPSF|nr:hypothetical protein HYPSUDRAFT_36374 [Hypholoma sublateritium FD-334 SS-4]
MENTQKDSETNTKSSDINVKEIAPTTLSVPLEETQGSSDWASTTLDALGPVINTPYPADKATDTDAPEESTVPDEAPAVTYITSKENQDIPGAYLGSAEELIQGEPSTLFRDAQYVRDMVAETLDHDAQYVKGVTAGAFESARGYAVKTGEAVGGYLPQSVAAYLPVSPITSQLQYTDSVAKAALPTSEETNSGEAHEATREAVPAVDEVVGPSKTTEIALAPPFTGAAEDEISTHPSPVSGEPSSVEVDPAVRRNTLTIPQTPEEPSETMHEGLGSNTGNEDKALQSPIADKMDSIDSEPHTHLALPTVAFAGMNGTPEKSRARTEETAASADASTRSLAGTQVDVNDTPGTSVFSGNDAYESQNGAANTAENACDTPHPDTAEPSLLARANGAPFSDGREYSTAAKQGVGEGVPFEVRRPSAGAAPAKESGPASPGAHRPTADSGVIDSTHVTPGHGPPVPPPKGQPAAERGRRASAGTGTSALAAAAAPGLSARSATGVVGSGNAAASSRPEKHAANGAVGKDVKGAEGANGAANGSTPSKKQGFFHKLKREFKALGGKHEAGDAAAK